MRSTRCTVGSLLIVGVLGAAAFGQGVDPASSPVESSFTLGNLRRIPEDPWIYGVNVGFSNPIAVTLDPQGPTWSVQLVPTIGGGANGVVPGNPIVLIETLVIGGDIPWTAWQENVLTPGFSWVNGCTMSVGSTPRLSVNGVTPSGLETHLTNDSLLFTFDPLLAGTRLTIVSEMVYTGTEAYTNPIELEQFPIPEPVTLALLGVAAVLIVRRRWVVPVLFIAFLIIHQPDSALAASQVAGNHEEEQIVESRQSAPDAAGISRRWKVVKTNLQHPYIRIEQVTRRDPGTGLETVVNNKKMAADHVIVRLKPGRTLAHLATVNNRLGAVLRGTVRPSEV